jgi:hypothetical protein
MKAYHNGILLHGMGVHGPVEVKHISDYPPEEQERMMNLVDPYRLTKKPTGMIKLSQRGKGRK